MIEFLLPIKREPKNDDDPFWIKYRYVIYFAVFLIFAIVVIIISFPKFPDAGKSSDTPEPVPENAFFKPSDGSASEKTFEGKMKPLSFTSFNEATHELVGASEKRLAYLYSKKHDLDLTSNINVVITGKIVKNIEGLSLIEVEAIKLK